MTTPIVTVAAGTSLVNASGTGNFSVERIAFRAAPPRTIDDDRRTVEVVAYSGAKVMRIDFWTGETYQLQLGLQLDQVRMGRLIGAPVLDSHSDASIANQIGVVEEARIDGGMLIAKLRLSSRQDVEPIWSDIRDGIIRNVSIGALIYKREKQQDGSYLATDWEPMEISIVPVPVSYTHLTLPTIYSV